jgi:hypothetical protein
MTMNKLHDDTMTIEINGFRHWKTPIVQGLEVGKLLGGRDPGQVQPAHLLALLVVVPLLANLAKTGPSKTMKFEAQLLTLLVGDNVNIGFFT